MATEEQEILLGTFNEHSFSVLSELEARLDAEEMERSRLRESLSSLESYEKESSLSVEIEEKSIVAIGSATVERQPSAEARTQQQPRNQSTKDGYRGIWRLLKLLAEIFIVLIVGFSAFKGQFTAPPTFEAFAQPMREAPIGIVPTQCCAGQPVQASCYVFEILDVHDLTPCTTEEEENSQTQDIDGGTDDEDEDEWENEQNMHMQRQDVSTFRVILSTATGQVHHIAFAFVNIPLVHGCALRRLRF